MGLRTFVAIGLLLLLAGGALWGMALWKASSDSDVSAFGSLPSTATREGALRLGSDAPGRLPAEPGTAVEVPAPAVALATADPVIPSQGAPAEEGVPQDAALQSGPDASFPVPPDVS